MFEGLEKKDLDGAIEAMLFVTDEPVAASTLAKMLECEEADVVEALERLSLKAQNENRGIQLRQVAGGWRFYTHPAFHDLIEKYVISWDTRKLSAAAIETLAIVAYTQPSTRASVASIRGVSSDSAINSLIEKGLIKEIGHADSPGNPTLYGTTNTFLEKFGLASISDLIDISEFAPDAETRALIAERLASTKQTATASPMSEEMIAEAISDALGDSAGVVEKIDFDKLDFDFDNE